MVDTTRTITDLLTNLFQDGQAAGAITPQDVRDLIVSLQPAHMNIYWSTPAATTISVAGTYTKALGTTTEVGASVLMDANAVSNRMRYTGAPGKEFLVTAAVGVDLAAGANQDIGIQLWRFDASGSSGALVAASEMRSEAAGTGLIQLALVSRVQLDTNDYLELHITNHSGTNAVTVQWGHMAALGIPV